ncbi:RNA polymerase sigma factor SigZ [Cesiribacter sp. SM1]|uniref:RNA polymerase sigma factor SigZ n=1 Tax=Cesiribacter sp. SM1 TaxID=2861196 RepID=UPI001CD321F9|nr:RNA polymerase sigma factor SigZ [Cesiribacter sp. SM1]
MKNANNTTAASAQCSTSYVVTGSIELSATECCTSTAAATASDRLCEQAWTVWQEHTGSLRRFLHQRTREHALTDDLLSEVMLKAYKNCERLAEVKDVRAWLIRVAQNTLTDHYRKKKFADLPAEDVLPVAEDGLLPEQRLAACLGEMLLLLPEDQRYPLQWADLEGLSQQEVANRLGISLSGAKSRIQRARVKLRQQLEACCRIETDLLGRISDYTSKNAESCNRNAGC